MQWGTVGVQKAPNDKGTEVKKAIVTGAQSGIGAACMERLRREGVETVSFDLAPGADFQVDVSDGPAVNAAVAHVSPVDILVNSAGVVGPNKPLWEISDEEWQKTFSVNVNGVFNMCRAVVPVMRERRWGRIVIALTKALGKELATAGILVNAIAPAVIETPMNATNTPEVLAYMLSRIPMGRIGQADEVAALVAWLVSDEVSFSTGAVYDISGGRATY
jgi:NAD(P)-dependent dehydrogenase (short-subunit alcohol dehydrogenase family)